MFKSFKPLGSSNHFNGLNCLNDLNGLNESTLSLINKSHECN